MSIQPGKKNIWIIGSSSGIGKALAENLYEQGHNLVLSARTKKALDDLKKELEANGYKAKQSILCAPCDVTDIESLKSAKENILKEFYHLDTMIFAAGIYVPMALKDFDHGQSLKTLDVNLNGALHVFEILKTEALDAQKPIHLAWVSSVAGYRGLPNSGAYGMSKAALTNFAEMQFLELSNVNTKVQVINPGFVKTRLTDKNDFEMPMILTAKEAARYIAKGLEKDKFEISFPPLFAFIMKCLRIMPHFMYASLARKLTK